MVSMLEIDHLAPVAGEEPLEQDTFVVAHGLRCSPIDVGHEEPCEQDNSG